MLVWLDCCLCIVSFYRVCVITTFVSASNKIDNPLVDIVPLQSFFVYDW